MLSDYWTVKLPLLPLILFFPFLNSVAIPAKWQDGFVGVFGRKGSFWWSCVECWCRSYLPCTLHQQPLFSTPNDLISKSFPPGPYEEKINRILYFLLPSFFPSLLFLFPEAPIVENQKKCYMSEPSHATAASKISSLSPFLCASI